MKKRKNIVLGVTGGIAAYRACDIIRRLQDAGCGVTVIMTRAAEEFITPLTLATLSGSRVYRDMFAVPDEEWSAHHIGLAEAADLLLIAPATANIIGKIAHGIADDLLTCVAMATTAPIVIAPSMNTNMYNNKIVRGNLTTLTQHGMHIIDPAIGKLACGTSGPGRLAAVDDIVAAVKRRLKK